ncbi:MAG TPA: hypothetical protein VGN37_04730 [Actinocatenispora sp.]
MVDKGFLTRPIRHTLSQSGSKLAQALADQASDDGPCHGALARYQGFVLHRDEIRNAARAHPLTGVRASIEHGSPLRARLTLTRINLLGYKRAHAVPKLSGGELWLVVEGPDFFWTAEVNARKTRHTRRAHMFAAAVNDAARRYSARET